MTKERVEMSVATDKDRTDWKYGRQFFNAMIACDPRLEPQTLGYSNAPNEMALYGGIESVEKYWGKYAIISGEAGVFEKAFPFMLRRTLPVEYWGSVSFTSRNIKHRLSMGAITMSFSFEKSVDWLGLFKMACESQGAVCGVLHILTEPELRDAHPQTPGSSRYYTGVGGYRLEQGIPNIAWATYFGDLYAKEVNTDKLRAHGYHVEELTGGYLVLMSDQISDVVDNFPEFSRRRASLKGLFRSGLFQINAEPNLT